MSLLAEKNPTAGAHTHSAETLRPRPVAGRAQDLVCRGRLCRPRWPRGGLALHARRPPARGLSSEERSDDGAVTVQSEAPEGVELLEPGRGPTQRVGSAFRPG